MKVYLPSDNPITQGFSSAHKGYDFSGLNRPDAVRCAADGEVIERADAYTTSWINTGTLTTRDYGNYIKVRHDDSTFSLYAHLQKGSSFVPGTRVKAGQTIARIGNTGNSTGPHLHVEYRTIKNINTSVEFFAQLEIPQNVFEFTDQTKIPLKQHGEVEIQALRGRLDDLKKAESKIIDLETTNNLQVELITDLRAKYHECLNKPSGASKTYISPLGKAFAQVADFFG